MHSRYDPPVFAGEEVFERGHRLHGAWVRVAAAAYSRLRPDAGECLLELGGCSALFAGDGSPLTQGYGLGVGTGDAVERLDRIFAFFAGRTSKWELILTPYELAEVWNLAVERGLRFDHFENMLFRPISPEPRSAQIGPEVEVKPVGRDEEWSATAMRAFYGEDVPDYVDELMPLLGGTDLSTRFWGLEEGRPVATATSLIFEDTAFLGGMGTIETSRAKGFQAALIDLRLRHAAEHGATLALLEALPGSSSHRNAERAGFRVAFTSAVMTFTASPD